MKFTNPLLTLTLATLIGFTSLAATQQTIIPQGTIKRADDVFQKWLEWQRVMPDKDIAALAEHVNQENYLTTFRQAYEKNASLLNTLTPFLKALSAEHINENGYVLRSPINDVMAANLSNLYRALGTDVGSFLQFLKTADLLNVANVRSEEIGENSNNVIEKYNALFQVLFANANEAEQQENLFTVANRFFEYCFHPQTFPEFERMLLDKKSYPLTRMMYAVTWYNLAGNGWKNWSEESLKALKARAEEGHHFVYIAGGSDIYHLIKSGIYNITNIDPQLPSQPKYYTNDWEYLLSGNIGDKIVFNFPDRVIVMTRTEHRTLATSFKARIATGAIIELPHSITTWTLTDTEGKKLGVYKLDRRFCEQSDFIHEPNKTMIMSFNELYFIALPGALSGWNIDVSKIDKNLPFVIKQLHKPVTKEIIGNMRIGTLLNTTDFKFIALGTCIN